MERELFSELLTTEQESLSGGYYNPNYCYPYSNYQYPQYSYYDCYPYYNGSSSY